MSERYLSLILIRDVRDQTKPRLFDNSFQSGCEKIIPVDVLCSEF
jgi:hypothetical protein